MRAEQLVLELRELLVRFDENLKANTLLQECVPYFLESEHPQITCARLEQAQMVDHIVGDSYQQYYSTNEHEKPFEEQYRMQPEEAHEYLHRVAFLREWLEAHPDKPLSLLDVACNDGWMAKNLEGLVTYTGVDLNPTNIDRARARKVPGACFMVDYAENMDCGPFDVVTAFELIEHVKDPDAVLAAMVANCQPGGSLFVSTPYGACTSGDLPRWWHVEPKGHVRAYTPETFGDLLQRHGECDGILMHKASQGALMVARVQVPA